eukprot:5055188-Pyramimonas_sp.AAC.1
MDTDAIRDCWYERHYKDIRVDGVRDGPGAGWGDMMMKEMMMRARLQPRSNMFSCDRACTIAYPTHGPATADHGGAMPEGGQRYEKHAASIHSVIVVPSLSHSGSRLHRATSASILAGGEPALHDSAPLPDTDASMPPKGKPNGKAKAKAAGKVKQMKFAKKVKAKPAAAGKGALGASAGTGFLNWTLEKAKEVCNKHISPPTFHLLSLDEKMELYRHKLIGYKVITDDRKQMVALWNRFKNARQLHAKPEFDTAWQAIEKLQGKSRDDAKKKTLFSWVRNKGFTDAVLKETQTICQEDTLRKGQHMLEYGELCQQLGLNPTKKATQIFIDKEVAKGKYKKVAHPHVANDHMYMKMSYSQIQDIKRKRAFEFQDSKDGTALDRKKMRLATALPLDMPDDQRDQAFESLMSAAKKPAAHNPDLDPPDDHLPDDDDEDPEEEPNEGDGESEEDDPQEDDEDDDDDVRSDPEPKKDNLKGMQGTAAKLTGKVSQAITELDRYVKGGKIPSTKLGRTVKDYGRIFFLEMTEW